MNIFHWCWLHPSFLVKTHGKKHMVDGVPSPLIDLIVQPFEMSFMMKSLSLFIESWFCFICFLNSLFFLSNKTAYLVLVKPSQLGISFPAGTPPEPQEVGGAFRRLRGAASVGPGLCGLAPEGRKLGPGPHPEASEGADGRNVLEINGKSLWKSNEIDII